MSRSIRSALALTLSALLLFSLFGCSADKNGDETTAADPADTTDSAVTSDTSSELNIEGNTLIFDNAYGYEAGLAFSNTMEALEKGYEKYKNVEAITVGEGKLLITFAEYTEADSTVSHELRCSGIEAFGHTLTFEESYDLLGNFTLYTFTAKDAFLFEYENLDTFLITKDGPLSLLQSQYRYERPADNADYEAISTLNNKSFYTFTLRDDGTLGYVRTPRKYLYTNIFADQIRYCTSLSEFAKEEGRVTLKDGQVSYHPEKTYTAAEVYDIEEFYRLTVAFASEQENKEAYLKSINFPNVESFEDFLEYNKDRYKEAE